MNDHALDALLAEYVAPPVPAGLAMRVAAAAMALPQEPRRAHARRNAAQPRHERRGKWLRRPMLIGGVALGLAVSGAVAASLAGIRIEWPAAVESVLKALPFFGRETPPDPAASPNTNPTEEPAPGFAPSPPKTDDAAPQVTPPPAPREDGPPAASPTQAAVRPDVVDPRLAEMPPVPPQLPPSPVIQEDRAVQAPAPETREIPARTDDDVLRLRQEQVERTERLRAARQAQIERLQRVQQRSERLRRTRRD